VTVIENYTFEDEEVTIDHIHFINCTFRDCTLVYYGMGETESEDSEIINCGIELRGPAEQGLNYLRTAVEDGAMGPIISNIEPIFPDSTLMVVEREEDEYWYVMELGVVPDQELEEIQAQAEVYEESEEEE